jgi:predicted CXXCH cytochrome family protein
MNNLKILIKELITNPLKNKVIVYTLVGAIIATTAVVTIPPLREGVVKLFSSAIAAITNLINPEAKNTIDPNAEIPEDYQKCFGCHQEIQEKLKATYRHVPFANGFCGDCHKPHNAETGKAEFQVPLGELCSTCHNRTKEKAMPYQHVPFKNGYCFDCHDPHGSENMFNLRMPVKQLCNSCHNMGLRYGDKKVHHPPFKNSECASCHHPHASNAERNLRIEVPNLCYTCHWATLPGYYSVVKHPPFETGKCLSCHHPHATDNPRMLHKPIPALCVGCHKFEQIGYWQKMHPVGDKYPDRALGGSVTCLSCHHPHGTDNPKMWKRPGNYLCFGCHKDKMIE